MFPPDSQHVGEQRVKLKRKRERERQRERERDFRERERERGRGTEREREREVERKRGSSGHAKEVKHRSESRVQGDISIRSFKALF